MKSNHDEFQMPVIDRMIHEPARLAILTVLSTCEEADFLFLERATKLSRGNLSVQLTRLEEANLVEIEKRIEHKRTLTTARLTDGGRQLLNAYWESMHALQKLAEGRWSTTGRGAKSDRPRPSLTGGLLAFK